MIAGQRVLTLEEFRKHELRSLPQATGELSSLLQDIALAAKRVSVEVSKAGLLDNIGETGECNIQGEKVQKLDLFAHKQFEIALRRGVSCAGLASEEAERFIAFDEPFSNQSKYVCVIDPLDGSGNIDVNISIGTVFGIYRRLSEKGSSCRIDDFLQPGNRQVAAGYIMYGSSTMFVYATRRGVNGFTLDRSIGEFVLSYPSIQCPSDGLYYSVNHGNFFQFDEFVKHYISECQLQKNANRPSQRYVGSLVADVHRSLLKGGIYMYPATEQYPAGKLRLVYECNPFAFLIEMAGGKATNGRQRILDVPPDQLHQRTPLFIGSTEMIKNIEECLKGEKSRGI